MIKLFLLLLLFSCEKIGVTNDPKWGCTDSDACNYDINANRNDSSSCIFPENFDCDSNCIASGINLIFDSNGWPFGEWDAAEDFVDCNEDQTICDGDEGWEIDLGNGYYNEGEDFTDSNGNGVWDAAEEFTDLNGELLINGGYDCTGVCGGLSVIDECGECGGDGPVENFNCDGDCIAETDEECECGVLKDECGECGGDGPEENFDCGGNCIAEDTDNNELDENGFDCAGICGGSSIYDCSYDPDHEETWEDACGGLQMPDCWGECYGPALLDNCGICREEGENDSYWNYDLDCSGECYGSALLDECGICRYDAYDPNWNSDKDCMGECFGSSIIDCDGECVNLLDDYNIVNEWGDIVFEDQFDSSEIDEDKWNFEEWPAYAFNYEEQAYTSRQENAYIEDGQLVIRALRENYTYIDSTTGYETPAEYTSARLNTKLKGDFKPLDCNGCAGGGEVMIEVKAKLPNGGGTWPAIWMLPTYDMYGGWPSSGEIDIMEHAPAINTDLIVSTVHTTLNNHLQQSQTLQSNVSQYVPGATQEFKIYRLIWSDDRVVTQVIDDQTLEIWNMLNFKDNGSGSEYFPFDQEFHLLLNLAIGGLMGGMDEYDIDDQAFPQEFIIDYVTVRQRGCIE